MSFFVLPAFDLFLIKYFYLLMSTQSDGFRHHIFTDILGDSPPLLPSTITLTSACALSIPNSLHSTFLLQISPCLHYSLFLLCLWLLFPLPWSPLLFHYLYLHSSLINTQANKLNLWSIYDTKHTISYLRSSDCFM